mgnify:CR=1 FL=1
MTDPQADLGDKQIYDPGEIDGLLEAHACHFADLIGEILDADDGVDGAQGVVCAPFDAELFGHWWFEGPLWIEKVCRKLHRSAVRPVQCGQYMDAQAPQGVVQLPEGSWGEGGFHWIWLNEWTEWTWKDIYECEDRFIALLALPDRDVTLAEVLEQAGRELLLLESSDWQFLISTWHARDYAENRLAVHDNDFERLASIAEAYAGNRTLADEDRAFLEQCRRRDPVFPDLDLDAWAL